MSLNPVKMLYGAAILVVGMRVAHDLRRGLPAYEDRVSSFR